MSKHSKNPEIEYISSIQMIPATNWTKQCRISYTGLTDAIPSVHQSVHPMVAGYTDAPYIGAIGCAY